MRLQRCHRHAAILAGVNAVTRMGATHGAMWSGKAPGAGQGQPVGRV